MVSYCVSNGLMAGYQDDAAAIWLIFRRITYCKMCRKYLISDSLFYPVVTTIVGQAAGTNSRPELCD
jgi:hypothetical protein